MCVLDVLEEKPTVMHACCKECAELAVLSRLCSSSTVRVVQSYYDLHAGICAHQSSAL